MKIVMFPLKVVTEGIWRVVRKVRKVLGRKHAWEGQDFAAPVGTPPAQPAAARPAPTPPSDAPHAAPRTPSRQAGGAGSAAFAAARAARPADTHDHSHEPPPGLKVGAAVELTRELNFRGIVVPAGARGFVEGADGHHFHFLWYTDQGEPIYLQGLHGPDLRLV